MERKLFLLSDHNDFPHKRIIIYCQRRKTIYLLSLQTSVVCLCFYFPLSLSLSCISSMLFLLGFKRDLDFARALPSHIRFKVDSVGFKGWTEVFSHFLCSMPVCLLLFSLFFSFSCSLSLFYPAMVLEIIMGCICKYFYSALVQHPPHKPQTAKQRWVHYIWEQNNWFGLDKKT